MFSATVLSLFVSLLMPQAQSAELKSCDGKPDLIVSELPTPEWESLHRQSIVVVVIKNTGGMVAGASQIKFIDGRVVKTGIVPEMQPGAEFTFYFSLPFRVYHPVANFQILLDANNNVDECNEENNSEVFLGSEPPETL